MDKGDNEDKDYLAAPEKLQYQERINELKILFRNLIGILMLLLTFILILSGRDISAWMSFISIIILPYVTYKMNP